ncbi:MAG: hypothetical protein ILP12_06325, partial [Lachnospiraceae bacterium]|nr:hypothetical protein [Lachnospiraceae bacterium]
MKAIRFWLLTALCAALLSGASFARVISTVEDLVALGGTAVSEDITLQEGVYDLTGSNWRPILSVGEGCTLDGGNAVIKGLDISRRSGSSSSGKYGFVAENYGTITNLNVALTSGANTGTMSAGVIAAVNNGLISNCRVFGDADAPVTITASLCYAGGIAGSNRGTIENCSVNDISFATAGQKSFVGGIAGQMSGGFIVGCTVYNVSILINNSADAGGIAGVIERGGSELYLSEIRECSVLYSSLSGDGGNVGGIAGSAKSVLVSKCRVNYVDLRHTGSGICNIGGLVGEAVDLPGEQVDFSSNYYADVFSANMHFQTGDYAGGIAGSLYASDSTRSVFTKCFFCSDYTAVPDICGSYQGNATADNFNECSGESKSGMTCDGWAEHALGEGWTNNGPEGYPVYSDLIPVSFARLHRSGDYLPRSSYRLAYDGTDVAELGLVDPAAEFDPELFAIPPFTDMLPVVIEYVTVNGEMMTGPVTAGDYG